jgi:hypothetical protein
MPILLIASFRRLGEKIKLAISVMWFVSEAQNDTTKANRSHLLSKGLEDDP